MSECSSIAAIAAILCGGPKFRSQRRNRHSDVQQFVLDHAMDEVSQILAVAGVEVIWPPGPSDASEANRSYQHATGSLNRQTDGRDYLVVKILRGFPDACLPGALGFSLPEARFGSHAMIFFNRIERVSASADIDPATMLGHAMAHEIGHVLLGSTEHSPSGIMKARWGLSDYQNAAKGCIRFTPSQCEVIREHILVRLRGPSQVNDGGKEGGAGYPDLGPSGSIYLH
jgi:hypothetical protein